MVDYTDIVGLPDLADLKGWLGLEPTDVADDVLLQESLDAAIAAQTRVCRYPCDDTGATLIDADLREALFLRAQRLAARRNSPEGVVGLSLGGGDFVQARLSSIDPDVVRLESPWYKIPVA